MPMPSARRSAPLPHGYGHDASLRLPPAARGGEAPAAVLPALGEATLRCHANANAFERGEASYRAGAVVALIQRGNALQAEVEGNAAEPYHVRLTFDSGGVTAASCSCAYSF